MIETLFLRKIIYHCNNSGDNTGDNKEYNCNNDRDAIKRKRAEMTYDDSKGYIRHANVINKHPERVTLFIPTKNVVPRVSKYSNITELKKMFVYLVTVLLNELI